MPSSEVVEFELFCLLLLLLPLVPPLPPELLTLFDEFEEGLGEAAAAAAATAAAAAAAEAAEVTWVVELSRGDRGGWLTAAGDEGLFGWGVPSVSDEVRRSCGEPPGGTPEAVAVAVPSYLVTQLFMGLLALLFCCRLFPPPCELAVPEPTTPVLFTYAEVLSEEADEAMEAMAAAA